MINADYQYSNGTQLWYSLSIIDMLCWYHAFTYILVKHISILMWVLDRVNRSHGWNGVNFWTLCSCIFVLFDGKLVPNLHTNLWLWSRRNIPHSCQPLNLVFFYFLFFPFFWMDNMPSGGFGLLVYLTITIQIHNNVTWTDNANGLIIL